MLLWRTWLPRRSPCCRNPGRKSFEIITHDLPGCWVCWACARCVFCAVVAQVSPIPAWPRLRKVYCECTYVIFQHWVGKYLSLPLVFPPKFRYRVTCGLWQPVRVILPKLCNTANAHVHDSCSKLQKDCLYMVLFYMEHDNKAKICTICDIQIWKTHLNIRSMSGESTVFDILCIFKDKFTTTSCSK